MKEENIYAGIAAFFIAATTIHGAQNPEPASEQAKILLINRVAVLPPKQDLLPKPPQIRLR